MTTNVRRIERRRVLTLIDLFDQRAVFVLFEKDEQWLDFDQSGAGEVDLLEQQIRINATLSDDLTLVKLNERRVRTPERACLLTTSFFSFFSSGVSP